MKRFLNILLIILIASGTAQAQRGQGLARIHAAKMAYISDRLRLTQEQSSNFIPVYNEYEKEVRSTRLSFLGKYKGTHPDDADDATSRKYIDDNLDYQQAIIDLKRKYNDRFLRTISPQQLADLYNAEREFRQILMKRLNSQQRPGRFR